MTLTSKPCLPLTFVEVIGVPAPSSVLALTVPGGGVSAMAKTESNAAVKRNRGIFIVSPVFMWGFSSFKLYLTIPFYGSSTFPFFRFNLSRGLGGHCRWYLIMGLSKTRSLSKHLPPCARNPTTLDSPSGHCRLMGPPK